MDERERRAAARRRNWTGEVVPPGLAKGPLYGDKSVAERWSALLDLIERAWLASGREMPETTPRSEWPTEVFELRRHG